MIGEDPKLRSVLCLFPILWEFLWPWYEILDLRLNTHHVKAIRDPMLQ